MSDRSSRGTGCVEGIMAQGVESMIWLWSSMSVCVDLEVVHSPPNNRDKFAIIYQRCLQTGHEDGTMVTE